MRFNFHLLLLLLVLITSCKQETIVREKDYAEFIAVEKLETHKNLGNIDKELDFWSHRLATMPGDIASQVTIASLLRSRFSYSGNIKEIHQADSFYTTANVLTKTNSSSIYRSLAANCVTQHRFRQAKMYLDSALQLGDNKYSTLLMMFDVTMELGDYYAAQDILKKLGEQNSFQYIIRQSKFEDHAKGNLDKAISLMEEAVKKARQEKNDGLFCWAKSNLGDMYSHANRFTEAYSCYLEVLKIDDEYYHCLKGIAWLAFSHDKNTVAAKNIIQYLKRKHPVPDYDLLLSEIAEYEGNMKERDAYLTAYQHALADPLYGDMYNKYNYNLYADVWNDPGAALSVAETEVNNRPTPESYSLLSWAYHIKGDNKKALSIARDHVEHHSSEPDVLYRLGIIYKANRENSKAKKYLQLARESSFELGPQTAEMISEALKDI
jgi:tetratricopeptide (TPR) repeat protein